MSFLSYTLSWFRAISYYLWFTQIIPQKQTLVIDHRHPHNNGMKTASERLAKRRKICLQYLIRWVGRKTLIILRTAVHLFHGVRDSSVSTYFVGVNCLPIKLLLVWVDRESFDPNDPALIDRYPDYTTETDLCDRSPTPTQQRDENSKRKACKKKKSLSAIPDKVSRTRWRESLPFHFNI
jgi:hypothetical protein